MQNDYYNEFKFQIDFNSKIIIILNIFYRNVSYRNLDLISKLHQKTD